MSGENLLLSPPFLHLCVCVYVRTYVGARAHGSACMWSLQLVSGIIFSYSSSLPFQGRSLSSNPEIPHLAVLLALGNPCLLLSSQDYSQAATPTRIYLGSGDPNPVLRLAQQINFKYRAIFLTLFISSLTL